MVKIKSGQQGEIKWSILKTACNEKEDFSKAVMCVFLIGNDFKIPYKPKQITLQTADDDEEHAITGEIPESASVLEYEVINNVIVAQIPTTLNDGVYGVEAIWYKDNLCKKTYAKVSNVFMVTDEAQVYSGNAVIRITSKAATYGYDGIDSYELAVLLGKTSLDRNSWVANLDEMNDKVDDACSNANKAAEEAGNAADAAKEATKRADEAVMNASGIEIDVVNNKLKFKDRVYDLTLSGEQPAPTPSGEKVVDKVVWSKPVITLEYNSQLPSAGGEISTRTFVYYQVKTTYYKNGYPAEQFKDNNSPEASVVWGGVAGAEGKFTIEPNKSGNAREYVVTVKVTANGVESEETKLTLLQPSMTATGTIYRNLVLTLQYPDAEAAGGLITPSKFTYTIDEVTQYSAAGFEDVKALSGNVSSEEIDHWANTDDLHNSGLTVAASTIAERHALTNKVKAWVNIYGVGKTVECEIWQKAAEIAETEVHKYEDLEVTSAYCDNIPASGGEVTPYIEYRLKDYVKLTDNSWRYKGYITTGCTIAYSGNGVDPTTGKVTKNTPSTSESESGVTTITYTISGYSLTKSGSIYVKQNGTGKQQEFMYVGSLASPLTPTSTDTDIEIVSNKRGVEEGNVSVSTTGTDKKKCHYLAIKIGSEYLVTKAVNVLGLDITDSVTPPMTIGSYNVYMLSSSAYISNTTTFTVSK